MTFCLHLDLTTLHITPPVIPQGYVFLSFDKPQVPPHLITQLNALTHRISPIPENAHVLFLTYAGQLVATRNFIINKTNKTAEGYDAFCHKRHRRKSLWKYLLLKSLLLIQERGGTSIIATTQKQFLWPFFLSLGFKKATRND